MIAAEFLSLIFLCLFLPSISRRNFSLSLFILSLSYFLLGIEAIVVDYIRPALFGGSTTIPNIAQGLVWALSAVTLGGLYYFNYTDVGVVNAIKMLWKL